MEKIYNKICKQRFTRKDLLENIYKKSYTSVPVGGLNELQDLQGKIYNERFTKRYWQGFQENICKERLTREDLQEKINKERFTGKVTRFTRKCLQGKGLQEKIYKKLSTIKYLQDKI